MPVTPAHWRLRWKDPKFKVSVDIVTFRVTIAGMKHHGQQQVGEESVCSAYTATLQSITEGS